MTLGGTTDAATVGAGSYTETLPAGASLPVGCGDLSTNPRQFMTPNAPAGPVPTNDWWSSLLFKRTDCAYSEPLEAHPMAFRPAANGLGVSYTTEAAMADCLPYYVDLFHQMKGQSHERAVNVITASPLEG